MQAKRLEPIGDEQRDHGAKGHLVAMGKVGKPQDAVDQRDAKGTKRKLAAIGGRRDHHEVEKGHESVDEIHYAGASQVRWVEVLVGGD